LRKSNQFGTLVRSIKGVPMNKPTDDTKSVPTPAPRAAWVKPTVRRIKAGAAEAGAGFGGDAGFS
jgi:hypothetical protein